MKIKALPGLTWDIFWELPQNLVGFLLFIAVRKSVIRVALHQDHIFLATKDFGVSLGRFVFFLDEPNNAAVIGGRNSVHEYGHAIQSKILGPSYLLLVGIPSILRSFYAEFYYRVHRKGWIAYYRGYPEDWADTLGAKHFIKPNK
ncbi:MAG: hypothetical protein R6V49_05165 [Bacteroidales bacterium]